TRARVRSCAHAGDLGHLRVVLAAPVRDVLHADEVELDREAVRVLDEDLIRVEVREGARLEVHATLLDAPDEVAGLGGQDGDVSGCYATAPGLQSRADRWTRADIPRILPPRRDPWTRTSRRPRSG